jgi:hypothetical protein
MTHTVYIGIDDTDITGSPGTGKVARGLGNYLEDLGLGTSLGVSRHQLLVDPRIPYTSHNSCKGLALSTERPASDLFEPCLAYIRGCLQDGADPGLCIAAEKGVTPAVLEFGRRAIRDVLSQKEARELAEEAGIFLKEIAGTGGGIIGALAAVGLRASGNDGRLVDLRGIREIKGWHSVEELLSLTDIDAVIDAQGNTVDRRDIIDTLDRVRPELAGGKAVLKVEPVVVGVACIWQPSEAKRKKRKEKQND